MSLFHFFLGRKNAIGYNLLVFSLLFHRLNESSRQNYIKKRKGMNFKKINTQNVFHLTVSWIRSKLYFMPRDGVGSWLWIWFRCTKNVSSKSVIKRALQFLLRCLAQTQYLRFPLSFAHIYEWPLHTILRAPRWPVT